MKTFSLKISGKTYPANLLETRLPQFGVLHPAGDAFGILEEHLKELPNENTESPNKTHLVGGDLVKAVGGPGSDSDEKENHDQSSDPEEILVLDPEELILDI